MRLLIEVGDGRYCVWSTNTDGPLAWGSKEEIDEYLLEEVNNDTARHRQQLVDDIARKWVVAKPAAGELIYHCDGVIPQGKLAEFLDSYDDDEFDLTLLKQENVVEEARAAVHAREPWHFRYVDRLHCWKCGKDHVTVDPQEPICDDCYPLAVAGVEARQWEEYWNSLTPEEQVAERKMMDDHTAKADHTS